MEVKKDSVTVRRAGGQATGPADNSDMMREIQQIKQELNNKQPKGTYLKPDDVQGMVSSVDLNAAISEIDHKIDTKQPAGTYLKPGDVTDMVSTQALDAAVNNLNSALNNKQAKGNYATKTEVQTISSALDTKQPIGNYATKAEVLTPAEHAAALKTLQDTIATKAAKGETVNSVIITDNTNKKWRLRIDDAGVVVTEEYNA